MVTTLSEAIERGELRSSPPLIIHIVIVTSYTAHFRSISGQTPFDHVSQSGGSKKSVVYFFFSLRLKNPRRLTHARGDERLSGDAKTSHVWCDDDRAERVEILGRRPEEFRREASNFVDTSPPIH